MINKIENKSGYPQLSITDSYGETMEVFVNMSEGYLTNINFIISHHHDTEDIPLHDILIDPHEAEVLVKLLQDALSKLELEADDDSL